MRILFVAMPDSVHTARWINQIADQGWDIHLFAAYDAPPHRDFRNITIYGTSTARPAQLDRSVRLHGWYPFKNVAHRVSRVARKGIKRLAPVGNARAARLARIIRQIKPDIVHSLELQHAGYLTLDARTRLGGEEFPTWIVTNWGSDIYLFGRLREHVERVRSLMAACDYYTCECHRDVELARAFGFQGEVLPVLPIAGGFDVSRMHKLRQPGASSARRTILLKGYMGWAGRSLTGLRAIELCAEMLRDYRIAIYLASPEVELAAELIAHRRSLSIDIVPHCPHEDMLRLHGKARISIGLNISDGISTSALETIVMGSFPIQSHTACFDEWIEHGRSGLLVHPEDSHEVAAALARAVTDDRLVDEAAEINARTAFARLDYTVIQPQVIDIYQRVGRGRARRTDKGQAQM